ncbi:methylenetetrahydrofolate reductase [Labedaea rhizosphaerae]|uniref:Methylenetetrahydrofolate reductase n=1 Tax=Labedaea rhizosphaerae TaxID=598644 RepID=A0A4R6S7X4_LABRH|nr:methylenetetrahydrofolate reductase [Labedaea rhizosphaerae]TDP96039.1 5,10-methylenetetrahydrofolate reductase (NAD(P)) [Labedaea rhizosphaerae]
MTSVLERISVGRPVFSVEFFPPRDEADQQILGRAIRELESLDPAFVSVTYGAGGKSRRGTIEATRLIAEETTMTPMAHLTAVDHSVAELRNMIGWYAAVGVRNILAVRGDPPGDPYGDWIAHPQGLNYAEDLVRLVRSLGDFCVGVAAFPYGHPRSADLDTDTRHLIAKFRAGAHFAIAQLFFEPDDFLRLRDRVATVDPDALLLPSVMPLTTVRTLHKTAELAGVDVPAWIAERMDPLAGDPAGFRAAGIDLVTNLCERLLAEGVPGLHFITMNRSKATREVVARLGLLPTRA